MTHQSLNTDRRFIKETLRASVSPWWVLAFRLAVRTSYVQEKCYTSRFRHMVKTPLHRYLCVLILLTLTAEAAPQQNSPSPIDVATQSFVQEILSRAGSPSAVTVSFQNISLLPGETQETAQNSIFTAFRNAGV